MFFSSGNVFSSSKNVSRVTFNHSTDEISLVIFLNPQWLFQQREKTFEKSNENDKIFRKRNFFQIDLMNSVTALKVTASEFVHGLQSTYYAYESRNKSKVYYGRSDRTY